MSPCFSAPAEKRARERVEREYISRVGRLMAREKVAQIELDVV